MAKNSPKWIENTVGKGEIARCEQFLIFPHLFIFLFCFVFCFFLKNYITDPLKQGLVWERVKTFLYFKKRVV